jgi:hypothetical protein
VSIVGGSAWSELLLVAQAVTAIAMTRQAA